MGALTHDLSAAMLTVRLLSITEYKVDFAKLNRNYVTIVNDDNVKFCVFICPSV